MSSLSTLYEASRSARASSGKGYFAQLSEILKLRFSFSGLSPSEYYEFDLYDDALSFEEKKAFVGWRGKYKVDRIFNKKSWHALHSDKLLLSLLLNRLGIPTPEVRAVYNRNVRAIPGIPYLMDGDTLHKFFGETTYPLFVKPLDAAYGRDCKIVLGFDSDTSTLQLRGSAPLAFREFSRWCEVEANAGRGGVLFQELVQPHPEIGALTGGRLIGTRLIVINTDGIPRVMQSLVKIPVGDNPTDNFHHGTTGNLCGTAHVSSGKLDKIFKGRGHKLELVDTHPDTRNSFADFQLPLWNECLSMVRAAATNLPGLGLQHWDVVLSDHGPVFLEVNVEGDLMLSQHAYHRGFLADLERENPEFAKHWKPDRKRGPLASS